MEDERRNSEEEVRPVSVSPRGKGHCIPKHLDILEVGTDRARTPQLPHVLPRSVEEKERLLEVERRLTEQEEAV